MLKRTLTVNLASREVEIIRRILLMALEFSESFETANQKLQIWSFDRDSIMESMNGLEDMAPNV